MNRADVLAKLQHIFDNSFIDKVHVTENLSAADAPEWDSMMHITLVVAVENAFGIRFGLNEVESTNNVGEFVDLILKKIGSR